MLRRSLALLVLLVAHFAAPPLASAQTTQPIFWGVNNQIHRVARLGNTVFAVGQFDYIGPNTGGGVPLDATSGAPLHPFPRVTGTVRAAIDDGAGGWFIGGDFSGIEGQPCSNLAHVLPDGTFANWFPRIDEGPAPYGRGGEQPVGQVAALERHGNTLYVGGRFTGIAGNSRPYLVAIDTRTGAITSFAAGADGPVTALLLRGNRLFVGGWFGHVGGRARSHLASLDPRNGAADNWNPSADGVVRALAIRGRSLFVGGEFDHAGGAARNSVAEIDLATGRATGWDAQLEPKRTFIAHGDWIWPYVSALLVDGRHVYAGGYLSSVRGASRIGLAAIDAETGRATSFDARIDGSVRALSLANGALYVGGGFAHLGDAYRPNIGAVDPATGACLAWDPRAYGEVDALAANQNAVYTGGSYFSIHDWYAQKNAAAFDAMTGAPLSWAPDFGGSWATSLVASEDERTLYAAGPFTSVNGQSRGHLAAFDAMSGALLPWNPWTRSIPGGGVGGFSSTPIAAMVRIGNTLYLGGNFDHIDDQSRSGLAAIDGTTGALLDWNPDLRRWDHEATALGVLGNDVFVAGMFDSAGLAPRRDFAQIDGTTGLAKAFDMDPGFYMWGRPDPRPPALMILPTEDRVYVGGWFYAIVGNSAFDFAAFDLSGAFTPFDARLDANEVADVGRPPVPYDGVKVGNDLYVAGYFHTIGGQPRNNVAALDPLTGTARDWNPDAGYREGSFWYEGANDLDYSHGTLYFAGGFRRFGNYPCAGLAAATLDASDPQTRPRPHASPLTRSDEARLALRVVDALAGADLALELALPHPVLTTLDVFDLQGRRMAAPLAAVARPAGVTHVTVDSRGWKSGLYYVRLRAGADVVTRKIVLLR